MKGRISKVRATVLGFVSASAMIAGTLGMTMGHTTVQASNPTALCPSTVGIFTQPYAYDGATHGGCVGRLYNHSSPGPYV